MKNDQAPVKEQEICLTCGFCCDGTLFAHAMLNPGEKGNLPERIEENVFSQAERDYFHLPCRYFAGRCTIYDSQRAYVCGSYRCQLLRDFSDGNISFDQALGIVKRARDFRSELMERYSGMTGRRDNTHFIKVLKESGNYQRQTGEAASTAMDQELFLARCNIFEALLIKHFRSADDFEKLVMK
jgi:hypothetical protein